MSTTLISLTNSPAEALIDSSDLHIVSQHNWRISTKGYAVTSVQGSQTQMHRLLLQPPPDMQVDHINRNRLDNRRQNLRVVTHQQNCMNRGALSASGIKGVGYHRQQGVWQAYIAMDGKQRYLGKYRTALEAAKAYNTAASELFGEHAVLNDHDEVLALEAAYVLPDRIPRATTGNPRGRPPLPSAKLALVAGVYLRAASLGRPTTRAVAETCDVSEETAKRWVRLARQRGHLPMC